MKFRQLLVRLLSDDSDIYGYTINFSDGLNIVRGDNSSGKSTFVNSMIYAIGMEEIIGSKGINTLPYALKDKFETDGSEKRIVESTVFIELENSYGEIITLKRSIVSLTIDPKLVQIIQGPYLTSFDSANFESFHTFLHDPGAAQDVSKGFFAYFENFLGLDLPQISDNRGKTTKLYLQSLFSALIIEQKRGWTDYIASIPYYGVSGMREKVASFIIDLDVFRKSSQLNELNLRRSKITSKWSEIVTSIRMATYNRGLSISGLNKHAVYDFDPSLVFIGDRDDLNIISTSEIRVRLFNELSDILSREKLNSTETPSDLVKKIEEIQNRIDELLIIQGMCSSQVKINQSQLNQYRTNMKDIESDLKSNKLTLKLVEFGADEAGLSIAKGNCPTCYQAVKDILASPDTVSMPMDLGENIVHLENQKRMTKSLIEGLEISIDKDKNQLVTINRNLSKLRQELVSEKRDIRSTNSLKEADIRRKISIENRISDINNVEKEVSDYFNELSSLSETYKTVNLQIEKMSKADFSYEDWQRIKNFSYSFKRLAKEFGYRSAKLEDVELKPETLLPYLKGIELRENIETPSERESISTRSANIKSDSSASDFVRLIWSYLISLYYTSTDYDGNHLGFIIFDEPAQHSMSNKSLNEMLKTLSITSGLQSIIAASFDESDETYRESTIDIDNFNLVHIPRKIISKIH